MNIQPLLSLLSEEDVELKVHALRKLNGVVDQCWSELAGVVSDIERLSEPDEGFPEPALAASVASQCFFHLEAYDQALLLAYSAGAYFDINARSEYVETLIDKCIEAYVALRTVDETTGEKVADADGVAIDERMVRIVELMFERCYADGAYTQAIGLALEAHRLDKLEESIAKGGAADLGEMLRLLRYTYDVCHTFVASRDYRCEIMRVLARLYHGMATPEYSTVCQCFLYLDEPKEVATILHGLIASTASGSGDDAALMAYQVAFDLCESENQRFLLAVYHELARLAAGGAGADGEAASKVATTATGAAAAPSDPAVAERLGQLRGILLGSTLAELNLKFLQENNQHKRDNFLMLKRLKKATEKGNNTLHHALVVTHAMFNCGTGNHEFLRENIDWMFKAKNWAQFSAVASLGVVHRGKTAQSRDVLRTYLPTAGDPQPYPNGGALYALGLIHANRGLSERAAGADGGDILSYLTSQLEASQSPVVQAGACLGLGLAGMTAGTEPMYEKMTEIMYQDDAVGGEAAAVAIGLLFAGRGGTSASGGAARAIAEGLTQAHDTKHEKIIRGIGMSMGLISFGQEEAADMLIDQLVLDQDPILRYGGMFTMALAYTCVGRRRNAVVHERCAASRLSRRSRTRHHSPQHSPPPPTPPPHPLHSGTSNNRVLKRLLHFAVSDVKDDVRRAAIISIGFVFCRRPELVPKTVTLLAQSYNPHVRYGACWAVGISCAGASGSTAADAIALLTPMLKDKTDFVRQAAMMCLAMVLMQHAEEGEHGAHVKALRKELNDVIVEQKRVPSLVKSGALLALGLLDAGGRNQVISLCSPNGMVKMGAAIGMALFVQHWYWFPFLQLISLCLAPTVLLGLNKDMKMPKSFAATCDAKPSLFAVPEPLKDVQEEKKERVETVVLSTTAKAAKKMKRKKKEKGEEGDDAMEVADEPAAEGAAADAEKSAADVDAAAAAAAAATPEQESFAVGNPGRVVPAQRSLMRLDASLRWLPVSTTTALAGVVILKDATPDVATTDDDFVEVALTQGGASCALRCVFVSPITRSPPHPPPSSSPLSAGR